MKKIIYYSFIFFVLFFGNCMFVQAKEKEPITLYFFHGEGCPHCSDEKEFLDTLSKDIRVVEYEVWYHPENASLLKEVQTVLKIKHNGVPFTVIGQTAIIGYGDGTGSQISRALAYYQESDDYVDVVGQIKDGTLSENQVLVDQFSEKEKKGNSSTTISVPFFGSINLKNISLASASVLIGLIDGFNPCAMWILLFLLGVLVGMKDRKKMWILGLIFLFTSAFVYMILMLSWLHIIVEVTTSIWIRTIIAIIAIFGAGINLRSFWKNKDGGCSVVSSNKRKKILERIQKFTHEKSFLLALFGVIGLAVSVNLVELACSAGLPVVFTQLLALNQIEGTMALSYTGLYILFFLLDDLIIFFIAMFTMKVTGLSTRYSKYSHLVGGIIMLIVGVLLLVKPEWLMFPFN